MSSLTDEIMGKLKGKKAGGGDSAPAVEPDADDMGDEESYGSDEEASAQDLVDAVKAGDAAGVSSALRAFLEICVPKIVGGGGE